MGRHNKNDAGTVLPHTPAPQVSRGHAAPSPPRGCWYSNSDLTQDAENLPVLLMYLPGVADLHERLATVKHRQHGWRRLGEKLLQPGVRRVAATKPDDLWRRAVAPQQIHEVAVLRHHRDTRIPGRGEDVRVFRIPQ